MLHPPLRKAMVMCTLQGGRKKIFLGTLHIGSANPTSLKLFENRGVQRFSTASIYFGIRFNRKRTKGERIWPRLFSKGKLLKLFRICFKSQSHVKWFRCKCFPRGRGRSRPPQMHMCCSYRRAADSKS